MHKALWGVESFVPSWCLKWWAWCSPSVVLQWLLCSCAEALNCCLEGYSIPPLHWGFHLGETYRRGVCCTYYTVQICTFYEATKFCFQVCKHLDAITRGGGQNKRARKNRGRPSGYSPTAAYAHIKQLVKSLPHFVDSAEEVIFLQRKILQHSWHSIGNHFLVPQFSPKCTFLRIMSFHGCVDGISGTAHGWTRCWVHPCPHQQTWESV